MENSKNIEGKVAEPKAEFTEDPDEAWLDDLVSHLNAMEEWSYQKNAAKVLMEDPMCKMHSQESYWNQVGFLNSTFLCFETENSSFTDVPPQENANPGAAGSKKVEVKMGKILKNAGTNTGKTTRDAACQVCINTPLKGSTLSGKHFANCK